MVPKMYVTTAKYIARLGTKLPTFGAPDIRPIPFSLNPPTTTHWTLSFQYRPNLHNETPPSSETKERETGTDVDINFDQEVLRQDRSDSDYFPIRRYGYL